MQPTAPFHLGRPLIGENEKEQENKTEVDMEAAGRGGSGHTERQPQRPKGHTEKARGTWHRETPAWTEEAASDRSLPRSPSNALPPQLRASHKGLQRARGRETQQRPKQASPDLSPRHSPACLPLSPSLLCCLRGRCKAGGRCRRRQCRLLPRAAQCGVRPPAPGICLQSGKQTAEFAPGPAQGPGGQRQKLPAP